MLNNQDKPNNDTDIEQDSEVLDFTRPAYSFVPKGYHEWRQHGSYLVCTSCELEHGVYVGVDRWLVGLDSDSNPIMKKVVVTE